MHAWSAPPRSRTCPPCFSRESGRGRFLFFVFRWMDGREIKHFHHSQSFFYNSADLRLAEICVRLEWFRSGMIYVCIYLGVHFLHQVYEHVDRACRTFAHSVVQENLCIYALYFYIVPCRNPARTTMYVPPSKRRL